MNQEQIKQYELVKAILTSYMMGLMLEKNTDINPTSLSGTYYISVPKDGVPTYDNQPMIYGAELAKCFKNSLQEYNPDCKVMYKIRDEYWTTMDVKVMSEVLTEQTMALKKEVEQMSEYNSL